MRTLLLVILPPMFLLLMIVLMLAVPLPDCLGEPWSASRSTVAAIVTGVLGMIYVVGAGLYAWQAIVGRSRSFDPALQTAGLEFTRMEGVARCYEGAPGDRRTSLSLSPSFKFQPWRLDVSVAAEFGFQAAIGDHRPLLDCRTAERITLEEPLADSHVHAEDETTVRLVLSDPAVAEAFQSLLDASTIANSWEVYLQRDRLWVRLRTYRLNEPLLVQLLESLRRVAETCEDVVRAQRSAEG